MNKDITNKFKLLVSLIVFPASAFLLPLLVKAIRPELTHLSRGGSLVLNEVVSLISFLVVILLFKDYFTNSVSLIFEKKEGKVSDFFKKLSIGVGITYLVKFIITFIVVYVSLLLGISTTVENQEILQSYVSDYAPLLFVAIGIIAPLCEETLFRGAFKEAIKNKWVFITVSGFIFGLMHVVDGYTLIIGILLIGLYLDYVLNQYKGKKRVYLSLGGVILISILCGCLLYFQYGNLLLIMKNLKLSEVIGSLTYIGLGLCLAYLYDKYNNIWIPIGVHATNNLLGFIAMLFL